MTEGVYEHTLNLIQTVLFGLNHLDHHDFLFSIITLLKNVKNNILPHILGGRKTLLNIVSNRGHTSATHAVTESFTVLILLTRTTLFS